MKKLNFKLVLLCFSAALLFSCEEDRVVYSGNDFVTFENGGEPQLSVFENAGTLTIPVIISMPQSEDITVNFTVTDNSAVSGVDYTLSSNSIVIPAGETQAELLLNVVDNTENNEAKSFTLAISSTSAPNINLGLGGDIGTYEKVVNIVNDDCPSKYTLWVGALSIEDVGYDTTPGAGAVTPAGTCDVLRVTNPGYGLADFPGFPGTGAPGYFDFVFTPDFDGATTGTVEVSPTPLATNGSVPYYATYEGTGVYDEDTATITIDYSVKAHTASYSGPVAGTYYTGTNIITLAP